MILSNGTLQIGTVSGGDAKPVGGYPDVSDLKEEWTETVPCLVTSARLNYLAKSQNENAYVDASYTVLVELGRLRRLGLLTLLERMRVRLKSNLQGELGEFSVIRAEPLKVVGAIKITV
jgi:hypothetical protein